MISLPSGAVLPALTVDDYISLAEEAWRHRHEAAVRTVADSGLKPEDRLRALDQLDQMRGTRGPLVLWAFSYLGAKRVVEASLKRGGIEPGPAMAGASMDDLMEAALAMLGVERSAKEDATDPTRAPAT